MNKTILSLFAAAACAATSAAAGTSTPVDNVSILVGTNSVFELSTGNTYPAVARPWGMNFWTPVSGEMGNGWTYNYNANKLRGFKQTHQPSPWINDYGQFVIMPMTGKKTVDENERASWVSHKAETATPYYYSIYLADYDVTAELAPTDRAAIFRFTFPDTDEAYVAIDALDNGSSIEIQPDKNRIVGYTTKNNGGVPDNFRNYFVVEFDRPFTYTATADANVLDENRTSVTTGHAAGLVGFRTKRGEQVNARVASSFISPEQALLNLRELDGKDIDKVSAEGRDRWNELLGRFEIEDDNIDNIRTFYSCLYRSLLFPHKLYEYDADDNIKHYSPYDGKVHDGYMFTGTGFWDTFRSLFPLVNLVYPSMGEKMQAGWANVYRESGFLPEWSSPGHRDCMIGNNSASVVADAYFKGLTSAEDAEVLWEAVTHGANNVHPSISSTGRLGYDYYNRLGYVPYNVGINESAARTLEYAYDDWCIYKFGKALGRPAKEVDIYGRRAMNYANVFDKEHNLMRGRNDDGTFQAPFNPLKWGDAFTEGNSWHYTWSVFHDPQGLIELMGGDDKFNAMMDSVFVLPPVFDASYYGIVIHEIREMQIMNMGNYAHGNQPIQHMIYLYDYSGQPWKAQYWIREVMDRLYSANPDGYCGDEDNGQTSAWYIFSSMGFYPVNPAGGQYALGTPYFKKMKLNLENGSAVTISAPDNSTDNRYIKAMRINGRLDDRNYVTYDDLRNGAVIDFDLAATPDTVRGTSEASRPYSFSNEKALPSAKKKK